MRWNARNKKSYFYLSVRILLVLLLVFNLYFGCSPNKFKKEKKVILALEHVKENAALDEKSALIFLRSLEDAQLALYEYAKEENINECFLEKAKQSFQLFMFASEQLSGHYTAKKWKAEREQTKPYIVDESSPGGKSLLSAKLLSKKAETTLLEGTESVFKIMVDSASTQIDSAKECLK